MLTHFLTSQPALIILDNENIGGHLTPLHQGISINFFSVGPAASAPPRRERPCVVGQDA